MLAGTLVAGGFCIELIMSLAVLSGVADRLAALVLAAYCLITALLWKQFWRRPDFRLKGKSEGREVLWDFREIDGRRGHRSGTVGDGPAALMIIQSEDAAAPSRPCEFR
jgi:putative oxidoreductase